MFWKWAEIFLYSILGVGVYIVRPCHDINVFVCVFLRRSPIFCFTALFAYKFQNLVSEGVTLLDNRAGHGLIKLQEKCYIIAACSITLTAWFMTTEQLRDRMAYRCQKKNFTYWPNRQVEIRLTRIAWRLGWQWFYLLVPIRFLLSLKNV